MRVCVFALIEAGTMGPLIYEDACQDDEYHVRCGESEVVIMQSATYGRMNQV